MPSSGGAGQPRVWLKTVKKGEEALQEHTGQNPAETENTKNLGSRNTKRGIRSESAINIRKMKRSLKRQIARKTHRKSSRGEIPLEPTTVGKPQGKDQHNDKQTERNKKFETNCLIKMDYGKELTFATLNIRGIKRLGKREKVEY